MNEIITNLLKLQSLEFEETVSADMERQIAELRAKVPPQVLGHYDRLVARGKKGVAAVRKQVCCECHMQVSRGAVMTLLRGEDIQLCECCGRYLYLAEPVMAKKTDAPVKKRKTPNKPEALLQTV